MMAKREFHSPAGQTLSNAKRSCGRNLPAHGPLLAPDRSPRLRTLDGGSRALVGLPVSDRNDVVV